MAARARIINKEWLEGQPAVPRERTGMVYLAHTDEDLENMNEMLDKAAANNEDGVRKMSLEELRQMEPSLNMTGVKAALYSGQAVTMSEIKFHRHFI